MNTALASPPQRLSALTTSASIGMPGEASASATNSRFVSATSVAALCNAGLLLIRLRQKGSYRPEAGWGWLWLKVLTAGLAMAALCWAAADQFNWVALQAQPLTRLGALLGIVLVSALCYLLMLTVLRVRWQDFLRRVPSASTSASTPPSP